jgi:hypothetical protein
MEMSARKLPILSPGLRMGPAARTVFSSRLQTLYLVLIEVGKRSHNFFIDNTLERQYEGNHVTLCPPAGIKNNVIACQVAKNGQKSGLGPARFA